MPVAGVAVIGGGAAGVGAIKAAREAGFDGPLHLVAEEDQLPYDRPFLSKELLSGAKQAGDCQLLSESELSSLEVTFHRGRAAVRLDQSSGSVLLDDGTTLRVARVGLATGGSPRRLAVPGEQLDGVMYLRSLQQGLELRERLMVASDIVVVGGGFIGTEVAAAAAVAGKQTVVVDVVPEPLSPVLGGAAGAWLRDEHTKRGVRFLSRRSVNKFVGQEAVKGVLLDDGTYLEAQLVVIGIGLIPNDALAISAGAAVRNGVLVDPGLRSTLPQVYAAGDVAHWTSEWFGSPIRVEHWRNAHEQGRAMGLALAGHSVRYDELPWGWTDQYDFTLQTSGLTAAADECVFFADGNAWLGLYVMGGRAIGVAGVRAAKAVRRLQDAVRARVPRDEFFEQAQRTGGWLPS